MIDPISAIAIATSSFNAVKKMVQVGQEFENVASQMGKWYGAVSDIRYAQQANKNPPLFKKLFAGGSVEEEALQLLMHDKKIKEQEYDLKLLLDFRYGHGTWDQMIEMRRKIKKERERTVYAQIERRRKFVEVLAVLFLVVCITGFIVFLLYLMVESGRL